MFSTLLTVALFFNLAITAVFADFSVSTPQITTCKGNEITVSWEPAQAPYNVIIVAADDPCGDALVDAGDFKTTVASFKTDGLKAGQKVQVSIEDSNGEEGWSSVITVGACPAASSAASSATSSSAHSSTADEPSSPALSIPVTTLIVNPTYGASSVAASPSPSVAPVGAANAANNPFSNSAAVPRHLSVPAVALTALAGAIALLL